jgi:hypothetical protein
MDSWCCDCRFQIADWRLDWSEVIFNAQHSMFNVQVKNLRNKSKDGYGYSLNIPLTVSTVASTHVILLLPIF